MSLIACTNTCVYQEDGVCRLEQAASGGEMSAGSGCVHFVKRDGVVSGYAPVSQMQPTALL